MTPITVLAETLSDPIYDTQGICGRITNLFCVPVGQWDGVRGLNKQWRDTNLVQAGMLESYRKLNVKHVWVALVTHDDRFIPLDGHPSSQLWFSGFFELLVNQKRYASGPLWTFAHPYILAAGKLRRLINAKLLNLVALRARYADLNIDGSQPLRCSVEFVWDESRELAALGVRIVAILDGDQMRPLM